MYDPLMKGINGASLVTWLLGNGFTQQAATEGQQPDYQGNLTAALATTWLAAHKVPLRSDFGTYHFSYAQPTVVHITAKPNGRILIGDADVAYAAASHPVKAIIRVDPSFEGW